MTTNAFRAGILVVAVIVGAVIIANAFPGTGVPGPSTQPSSSPTPTPTPSGTPTQPPPKVDCSTIAATHVAVENATSTAGLAGAVATRLQKAGFTINKNTDVGNAPTTSTTTAVYFQGADNKDAAKCVRKRFFHGAKLGALPPSAASGSSPTITASVQVAVFLGSDYAAAHPVS